jgi:hypothetical protein
MTESFCSTLKTTWCKLCHGAPMWPMHGYYRCSICLRKHPVPWACRGEGPVGHSGVPAGVHSAPTEVNGFGVPQVAYAGQRRRNS